MVAAWVLVVRLWWRSGCSCGGFVAGGLKLSMMVKLDGLQYRFWVVGCSLVVLKMVDGLQLVSFPSMLEIDVLASIVNSL